MGSSKHRIHCPWYNYIVTVAEKAEMVFTSFEPKNTENLYQFSYHVYEEDGQIIGPHQFFFDLSDEEYIFLLSHLLFEPQGFTYNSLCKYDMDFFDKFNNTVNSHFFNIHVCGNITHPFLVIFDEIVYDAKQLEDEKNQLMIDFVMDDIMEDDEENNDNNI